MHVLVTGGYGFIGSHLIRFLLAQPEVARVVNIDALTYAASEETLKDLKISPRYHFYHADITDQQAMEKIFSLETELAEKNHSSLTAIINVAAESHVDRSILSPHSFIQTNVLGTELLLELARHYQVKRFLQVSTDEVYGSLLLEGDERFVETTPLNPSSPYAASKASADLITHSAYHTYQQDVVITRCSNNYGAYQFPEKLIPLMTLSALEEKPLPLYGSGEQRRSWISVTDHITGLWKVLLQGSPGNIYHIGTDSEMSNRAMVEEILAYLNKPTSLITSVLDRPGHDQRYTLDCTKIKEELGWQPQEKLEEALPKTINWYLEHRYWWEPLLKRIYQS